MLFDEAIEAYIVLSLCKLGYFPLTQEQSLCSVRGKLKVLKGAQGKVLHISPVKYVSMRYLTNMLPDSMPSLVLSYRLYPDGETLLELVKYKF